MTNAPPSIIPREITAAPSRVWFRRYPVAMFLISLIFSFVSAPFEESMRNGDLIEVVRFTVVLLAGMLAVSGRHRGVTWVYVVAVIALGGKWLNHWQPTMVPAWTFLLPGSLFVIFVFSYLMRFIMRAPRVTSEVLCAGLSGYLILALLWSIAYILVASVMPNAFAFNLGPNTTEVMKGFTAIYYSVITLTSTGYGDIIPLNGVARMLAMTEAMTGTIYIAVLIARLVSLYVMDHTTAETPSDKRIGNG